MGKKRSLSEIAIKSNQRGEKSSKRTKFAGLNGNPNLKEKASISMDKQRKEQNTIKQQSNDIKSSEIKKNATKEKLTIVKPKNETTKSRKRRRRPYSTINFTVEQITKKIMEIKSRDVMSKRAIRILGILNRKLRESENVGKKNRKQNAKWKANEDKIKVKYIQNKSTEEDDDQDISDESLDESNEFVDDKKIEIDNESDEETDDEKDKEEIEDETGEDDEEEDDEEDDDEEEDDEEDDDEENDEEEDDEDDEEDEEDKRARISEVRKKENKKIFGNFLDDQKKLKKKRYVLFVSNLPLNITEDEIKQHFLTKVDTTVSVRTKPDKTGSRGFAYVEVTNNIDFEKGLSLNHSFLKKRRINVHSMPSKKTGVTQKVKNMKLQKIGKLTDGKKRKPFKKGK